MVNFHHDFFAAHYLESISRDLKDAVAEIKYKSVFEAGLAVLEYHDTACELQELIEECLNARLDVLDADSETRNMVKEYATISFEAGFSVCMIIELLHNQMWITKGLKAKENEERTILAANARESAKAARRWQPYREEFQRLVSEDGMKPDTARSTILNNWAEPKGAPSMKTARKWLRLDGEAD